MPNSKDIENVVSRIDFTNLCGGNDFAALTNGYDRKKINELVWSIEDYTDRKFLINAITISKKIEECNQNDCIQYLNLLAEGNELQENYRQEKTKLKIEPSASVKDSKGYNTTESAVLMYFLNDQHSVNTTEVGEKNCLQKNAQTAYSKTFGWSEKSYEGKINPDFTDPAVRKAMEKIANDYKDINPKMVEEIRHQYNEYEDDFYEKHPEKLKKIG